MTARASHGVTIRENVNFQRTAIVDLFGIERFALAAGWSMGAQQAYQWAGSHPDTVAQLAIICGAARTASHNAVFLKSLETALLADPDFEGGGARGGPPGHGTHLRRLGLQPSLVPRWPPS